MACNGRHLLIYSILLLSPSPMSGPCPCKLGGHLSPKVHKTAQQKLHNASRPQMKEASDSFLAFQLLPVLPHPTSTTLPSRQQSLTSNVQKPASSGTVNLESRTTPPAVLQVVSLPKHWSRGRRSRMSRASWLFHIRRHRCHSIASTGPQANFLRLFYEYGSP